MLKPNTSYPTLRTLPILVEVGLDLFVLLKNRDLNRPIVTFPDMPTLHCREERYPCTPLCIGF